MGSWDVSCEVTKLPINCGDECYGIWLADTDEAWSRIREAHYERLPLASLPLRGRYDDCGTIDIDPDQPFFKYNINQYPTTFIHKSVYESLSEVYYPHFFADFWEKVQDAKESGDRYQKYLTLNQEEKDGAKLNALSIALWYCDDSLLSLYGYDVACSQEWVKEYAKVRAVERAMLDANIRLMPYSAGAQHGDVPANRRVFELTKNILEIKEKEEADYEAEWDE